MENSTVLKGGLSPVSYLMSKNTSSGASGGVPGAIATSPSSFDDLDYEIVHFKEGDVLFRQGEESRGLYYVQSGCVKMFVLQDQVRGRTATAEYVTRLVGPGEYFGYKAIVRGGLVMAEAKAVKPTTVWIYNKKKLEAALNSSSPIVRTLLKQAVSDLEGYEQTSQLHYLASVQERIAYQLVILADRFGVKSQDGISLNLKLTRNELAQLASTINESLSRHLTEFKNEGLIDLNGKEIIIKNRAALMAKSGNFKLE